MPKNQGELVREADSHSLYRSRNSRSLGLGTGTSADQAAARFGPGNWRHCVCASLMLLLLAGPAAASHRFDMGPAGSALAPGFVGIAPADLYNATVGHGWLVPPATAPDRTGSSTYFVFEEANFPPALIEDSVASSGAAPPDFSFRVDVAPGLYWGFAYLGDLGDPALGEPGYTPLEGMGIRVNGLEVVKDAFAELLFDKASHWLARGGYKRVAFLVEADASAQLSFHFESAADNPLSLMGLEIHPYSEPPVSFDRSAQQLVVAPAYANLTELVAGVADMNAHDYPAARAHFDQVSDELAQAWGHAWWLGWLTDDEAAVDERLLEGTRLLLESLAQSAPDNPAVLGLLYELRDFQWGELFGRTRDYQNFPNPKSLGGLLDNLCAGVQFLEQMDADVLSDGPSSVQTQSPFFAKAQYLAVRNMYGRNTHLSKQKTVKIGGVPTVISFEKFGLYMLRIFGALWPRLDPGSPAVDRIFPQAYEALMLDYRIQQGHPDPDGTTGAWSPLGNWDGSVPAISESELQNTWWFEQGYTDLVSAPGTPPDWASLQRNYSEMLRGVGEWWIDRREIDGELGGGTGDDVEAAAVVVPRLAVSEGFADTVEGGFKRVLDQVIEASDFDEAQGYVNYVTDSAHGGENASFPLIFYLSMRYGDARYLNQAMHNIRNMDEQSTYLDEGEIWIDTPGWAAGLTPRRKYFRGFWFSAEKFQGNPSRHDDIPINYRTILGGFPLMDYNGSPRTVELFEEHAWGWADAAMSTAPLQAIPKSPGVIPVSVEFESGDFGAPENGDPSLPNRWWAHGEQNSGSLGGYNDVVYAALYDAYQRSIAPNRADLLRPLHEAVDFVRANLPDADASVPSDAWVSSKIHKAVVKVAFRARLDLEAEWQTPLPVIDAMVAAYGGPYPNYLALAQGQPGGKPKDSIEATWEHAETWLRYFFPLATVTVSYTDRLKIAPKMDGGLKALHGLYTMRSGAPAFEFVPTNPISWTNPDLQDGLLDLALLVNDYTPSDPVDGNGQLKILAYNFSGSPKTVRMKLWRVLTPGQYQIRMGPDNDFDDEIDGVATIFMPEHSFGYKGDFVDLTLPSGELQVIELSQQSVFAGSSAQVDLGLSEDLLQKGQIHYHATVSSLGALDYDGSWATLELVTDSGVESVPIPALSAPGIPGSTGLEAQTWTHMFSYIATPPETLTLRIVGSGDVEITEENNAITQTFPAPEPNALQALLAGLLLLAGLARRSPAGVEKHGPGEVGVAQRGVGQPGVKEVGVGEVDAFEAGAVQIGPEEIGLGEVAL